MERSIIEEFTEKLEIFDKRIEEINSPDIEKVKVLRKGFVDDFEKYKKPNLRKMKSVVKELKDMIEILNDERYSSMMELFFEDTLELIQNGMQFDKYKLIINL